MLSTVWCSLGTGDSAGVAAIAVATRMAAADTSDDATKDAAQTGGVLTVLDAAERDLETCYLR